MAATLTYTPLKADARGVRTLAFKAMGTNCSVKFRLEDELTSLEFARTALDWVSRFEARYSRFRPDSVITAINREAGASWVAVDEETEAMLDLAELAYHQSDGAVDATMLPLLRVWDWKQSHEALPETSAVRAALEKTGWRLVERRKGAVRLPLAGMGLDFGGFGKEYAVDQVAKLARAKGIQDALIDFGRDIFAMGGNGEHPFWHIGIEDGNQPGNCWGGLAVSGQAVCSSGDYHRFFSHAGKRYGHILDPRTGWPVSNGMRAVTVVAPSCLQAGIYSTAVFVLGPRKGLHLASLARGVEVCAQSESGIEGSRGFGRFLVKSA